MKKTLQTTQRRVPRMIFQTKRHVKKGTAAVHSPTSNPTTQTSNQRPKPVRPQRAKRKQPRSRQQPLFKLCNTRRRNNRKRAGTLTTKCAQPTWQTICWQQTGSSHGPSDGAERIGSKARLISKCCPVISTNKLGTANGADRPPSYFPRSTSDRLRTS